MPHPTFSPVDVIAVAPMAGRGTRLGLPFSKELAPLGSFATKTTALSEIMFRRLLAAGIQEAVLAVADHKQDIPDFFGDTYVDHSQSVLNLSYVTANDSPNTPTSIDAGFALTRGRVCALGFADILYRPCPGYARALRVLAHSGADLVLGLFPTSQAASVDMVAFDTDGQVREILIKQAIGARYAYTWSLAVWRPTFTNYLHRWLREVQHQRSVTAADETYVGDVMIAAMAAGLRVKAVVVSARASLDAGTPQSLEAARRIDW